jgi:hypothetical protein
MKRISIIVLVIMIAVAYCYFSQTTSIEAVLVYKQKNPSKQKFDFGPTIFVDLKYANMNLCDWVGDSLPSKTNIDFKSNDYLVAFGKPLKDAYYYKFIGHPHDDCGYMKEVPLTTTYQDNYTDTIYFYRIKKGKYRSPCP